MSKQNNIQHSDIFLLMLSFLTVNIENNMITTWLSNYVISNLGKCLGYKSLQSRKAFSSVSVLHLHTILIHSYVLNLLASFGITGDCVIFQVE